MMRTFFLFFLVGSTALANPPQLAVSNDDVCLLGEGGRVKCWESDVSPRAIFGSEPVEAIAASEVVFCAIQKGKVNCASVDQHRDKFRACLGTESITDPDWMLQGAFRTLSAPRMLAGGYDDTFCVWDELAGIQCANAWQEQKAPAIPVKEKPLEMAVIGGGVCAILANHQLRCWGPYRQLQISERSFGRGEITEYEGGDPHGRVRPPFCENYHHSVREQRLPEKLFEIPRDLKEPRSLFIGTPSKACVIDENILKCWGDSHSFDQSVPTFAGIADIVYPEQFAFSLWLDGGNVRSFRKDGWEGALPGAALLARKYSHICAANDTVVRCNLHAPIPHDLPVHYRPLGELVAILRRARTLCYLDRRPVYDAAIERMLSLTPAGQAFVFQALAPLIQGTTSDAFETRVKPHFARALTYWGPRATGAPEDTRSALRLLLALLPSPEDRAWANLKVAIGMSLAQDGTRDSILAVLREASALENTFVAYETNLRTRPSIASIRGLVEKLRLR